MISVRINGTPSSIRGDGLPRLADLVELIKSSIDPDHMITAIHLDGRELEENQWYESTNQFETAILEVETGRPEDYVTERLDRSASVVRSCYMDFRDARKRFQAGDTQGGNQKLIRATTTLKAFFEWYSSLLELVPVEKRPTYDITNRVVDLSETCKRICQQQLYQSWWALGESLEKELEPKLDKLEDFCRKFERPFS